MTKACPRCLFTGGEAGRLSVWAREVPTDGKIDLPPDPRALETLGRNHSLETALADLVDNSIDADATNVVIRFVKVDGRLRSLCIADNGRGMTPSGIDSAMTVGGRRDYDDTDLGHFGLGLKAASFSQARRLTVMSRAAGSPAVGRQWKLDEAARNGFECDIVASEFAEEELSRDWHLPPGSSGTVIRWDDVDQFPQTSDPNKIEPFINHQITEACQHLGMVFHRFIEDQAIKVSFEVQDVDETFISPPVPVEPLNPFGYLTSGKPGYPKVLSAADSGVSLSLRCHIWSGRSNLPQFKLAKDATPYQGFYFYRRNRLLQPGGWFGVHVPDTKLQLARAEVDIDGDLQGFFRMNPEKSRVIPGPEFEGFVTKAQAEDGTTFDQYLEVAEQTYRIARSRSNKRKPKIYAGSGLPPRVRAVIESEVPEIPGEEPINIRWSDLADERFFEIDREERVVWLNKRYRKILLGGKHGGLNDLPLVKSLLYLLTEDLFHGEYFGVRDRDNLELWQAILTTAAQAERR